MAIKNIGKVGLAGLLAAASLGGAALAHEGGFGGGFGGGKGAPPELLQKYDANKDGKLDDTERAALKQDVIKKFDANGNGQIDPEERQKMHEERSAERFKQLDTNGDGQLSLSEFQAGAQMHGRHGFRGQR